MKTQVLVLSQYSDLIRGTIEASGCDYLWRSPDVEVSDWPDSDWVVSFGYRKIIPSATIERFQGRIINIHISLLPLNKGSDPNFWSWFDDTLKGVTIHRVSDSLDGGEILAQREMPNNEFRGFPPTLASAHTDLLVAAAGLFDRKWRHIMYGRIILPVTRNIEGSYHRSSDKSRFLDRLPLGWLSPVTEVQKLGLIYRGRASD